MTIAFPGDGSVRKDVVEVADDVAARLMRFHRESRFASRGGVITDLDGTAVLERKGRVYVAEPVAEGLKALADQGRPVALNTAKPSHRSDWRDWLDADLEAEARLAFPHAPAMISASQLKTLTKTLTTVRQWREAPVLNHSDLRLKNVIVDADGLVQGHAWRHHRIGTHAHAPKRALDLYGCGQ